MISEYEGMGEMDSARGLGSCLGMWAPANLPNGCGCGVYGMDTGSVGWEMLYS